MQPATAATQLAGAHRAGHPVSRDAQPLCHCLPTEPRPPTRLGSAARRTCRACRRGSGRSPTSVPRLPTPVEPWWVSLSHSVGNIKFAADGSIFVTTSDAAHFNYLDDNALRSQNLDLLSGKLLRYLLNPAR